MNGRKVTGDVKQLKKPDAATFFQEIAGAVELQKFMRARADFNGELSMRGNIGVDAEVFKGIIKGVLGKKAAQELEDDATKATNSECDSPDKLKPKEADDFDPATPSEQAKPKVAWDREIAHAGEVRKWKKVV